MSSECRPRRAEEDLRNQKGGEELKSAESSPDALPDTAPQWPRRGPGVAAFCSSSAGSRARLNEDDSGAGYRNGTLGMSSSAGELWCSCHGVRL